VRLYTLFIGPPEKDAEWSDRGVEGAYRFLSRVWRLVERAAKERKKKNPNSTPGLKRKMHQTIKKVTDDIEKGFHFNTAISAIMELVNEIYSVGNDEEIHEAAKTVVLLLSPFVPHVAEELWEKIGNKPSILKQDWPLYDKSLIEEEQITIPVQVNGRLRSKVLVRAAIVEDDLKSEILSDEKVKKWTEDKNISKWIIIPKKLVNILLR